MKLHKACIANNSRGLREILQKASVPPAKTGDSTVGASTTAALEQAENSEQRIFVRADKLDNPYPGLTFPHGFSAADSLGASLAYTSNNYVESLVKTGKTSTLKISSSDSVAFTGLASYAFIPEHQSDKSLNDVLGLDGNKLSLEWVPSVSLYGNGNWDHPTKTFGDVSVLKAGPEFDFLLQPAGSPLYHYFGVNPFVQTDYCGLAQASGTTLSYTPSFNTLFINGAPPLQDFVDGFVEIRGEYTYLDVDQPGKTLLHKGVYDWVGVSARAYIFLFPTRGYGAMSPWPDYLADRVNIVGTVQSYRDTQSGIDATLYSAALQYKLSCNDKSAAAGAPSGGSAKKDTCNYGSTSLTLQYDHGMDKDLLQETKKVSVKLNYAF